MPILMIPTCSVALSQIHILHHNAFLSGESICPLTVLLLKVSLNQGRLRNYCSKPSTGISFPLWTTVKVLYLIKVNVTQRRRDE